MSHGHETTRGRLQPSFTAVESAVFGTTWAIEHAKGADASQAFLAAWGAIRSYRAEAARDPRWAEGTGDDRGQG